MIKQLKPNVIRINFKEFGSCVYLIKLKDKFIMIDTGSPDTVIELKESLAELGIKREDIKLVILTHFHYDHTGGLVLLRKIPVYASKKDFGENVIDIKKLKIPELKIIETPGHSKGGICILYEDILFSGDTLFNDGIHGRTDLAGGSDEEIQKSLNKLCKLDYKILAPGHV